MSQTVILVGMTLGIGVVLFMWFHRVVKRHSRTDYGARWLNWLEGFNRLFCHQYHRLQCDSLDLPDTGPAVVVSNHISGLDAPLLIAASDRPLRFMIAREQYDRFGLRWLFRALGAIPVDRSGRPEKAMREALAALEQGDVVALFPHGKIHLPTDPPRKLKGGAARLALNAECPLHPTLIEGVARQGHIFGALMIRGQAKLTVLPEVDPAGKSYEELMQIMEQIYNTT